MVTQRPTDTSRDYAKLVRDVMAGKIGRREVIKRGAALGLSAPAIAGLLGNYRSAAAAPNRQDLSGQSFDMTILGIAGWPPSRLGVDLANELFAPYAQENYGYTVNFGFEESPFDQLFQRIATSLETGSDEYNIIISDSQWLGALASREWIVQLNDIIAENPELDIEFEETAREGYMVYPDGTDNLWGFPQEGDTIALFVRQDLFSDADNQAAFEEEYGFPLPQTFEDWEEIDIDQYENICQFFNRPDENIYGTALQWSRVYDFISCYAYPFMFSNGGEIWDPETGQVEGILDSEINAAGLARNRDFLQYAPPGAINYGIAEQVDAFGSGILATCWQWAAVAPEMINAAGDPDKAVTPDDVIVVPPPGFRQEDGSLNRTYTLGGQPWVINAFNGPEQMRIAIDFMKFWYLPETQLEFANRGGNPSVREVLDDPGFDDLQPHFRAYKYMLRGNSRDFWHSPSYSEMLAAQQEAFSAYASGVIDDPMQAMKYAACQQQRILYDAAESDIEPSDECSDVTLS